MNGTEENSFLSLSASIATIITIATIMVLDLLGNTLVLCVLYRQRRKLNLRVGNMFLANLSLIDLIMGVLLIPFSIAVAINGRDILNDVACQINGFMNILVGSASIWTLAVISVDRWVFDIVFAFHYFACFLYSSVKRSEKVHLYVCHIHLYVWLMWLYSRSWFAIIQIYQHSIWGA